MTLIDTPHFNHNELLTSKVAKENGIDNTPKDDTTIQNLNYLISQLELIRSVWEHPIIVTSGYRSQELNNLVNGSKTSAHLKGLAADIISKDMDKLLVLIKDNFDYDQLINEHPNNDGYPQWIHIGFRHKGNRHQYLIKH